MEAVLTAALRLLSTFLGPLDIASLYRTAPVSPIPQPDYLNTAAVGRTLLSPDEILALGKAAEHAAGRRRTARDAPRPLDIDLLLYGTWVSDAPELRLPHPGLCQRSFVLAPLAEIAPHWPIPPAGPTVAEALAACMPGTGIRRIGWGR